MLRRYGLNTRDKRLALIARHRGPYERRPAHHRPSATSTPLSPARTRTPTRLIIRRIHELRGGRSKTFRLRVRLPQAARARYCFSAVALADSARLARARLCARVVPR